jgi:hypothetical protein
MQQVVAQAVKVEAQLAGHMATVAQDSSKTEGRSTATVWGQDTHSYRVELAPIPTVGSAAAAATVVMVVVGGEATPVVVVGKAVVVGAVMCATMGPQS